MMNAKCQAPKEVAKDAEDLLWQAPGVAKTVFGVILRVSYGFVGLRIEGYGFGVNGWGLLSSVVSFRLL